MTAVLRAPTGSAADPAAADPAAADPAAADPAAADPAAADPAAAIRPDAALAEATLAEIARVGLARLSVDAVARAAGVSRATLYRRCPGKPALVGAALDHEVARAVAAVAVAVADARALDDAVAAMFLTGARTLATSVALGGIVAADPGALAPYLDFAGGDALLARLTDGLAPLLAPWAADPRRAAEWVARIGIDLCRTPTPLIDPTDPGAVRRFVATFVTPGIAPRGSAAPKEEGP
ncbi:MAG: helix-turn-helix transcriptional regulator [Actinobacteria bacterium]|nr:helix-turn-helix transcriptional regulator [Actinomycetota bacterium]